MIVALSGGLGSGKSSVSQAVARRFGWPRASFGAYVRAVAEKEKVSQSREALQELGANLLQQLGPNEFCVATLRHGGWTPGENIVLDGVRHRDVVDALSRFDLVKLVYLVADEQTRVARLQAAGRSEDNLPEIEQHSTEAEVRSVLYGLADVVVDATLPVERIVDEIAASLIILGNLS